jgi:hypothetical protein
VVAFEPALVLAIAVSDHHRPTGRGWAIQPIAYAALSDGVKMILGSR